MYMELNVKWIQKCIGNPLYETGHKKKISSQTSLQADLTSIPIDCHIYS